MKPKVPDQNMLSESHSITAGLSDLNRKIKRFSFFHTCTSALFSQFILPNHLSIHSAVSSKTSLNPMPSMKNTLAVNHARTTPRMIWTETIYVSKTIITCSLSASTSPLSADWTLKTKLREPRVPLTFSPEDLVTSAIFARFSLLRARKDPRFGIWGHKTTKCYKWEKAVFGQVEKVIHLNNSFWDLITLHMILMIDDLKVKASFL